MIAVREPVRLTLEFDPPVTAADLRETFQDLADAMAEAEESNDGE